MKEDFKNYFQVIMMPLWRRKYLLVSGCLVWATFYLYLHYSTSSPDISNSENTYVKHPVDTENQHITSAQKLISTAKTSIKSSAVRQDYSHENTKQNDAIVSYHSPISHTQDYHTHNHDSEDETFKAALKAKLQKKKEQTSIRDKYIEKGIKPTSFLVKPRTKETTLANITTPAPKPSYYIPPLRLVHFDLKGAPPKVTYFKSIFPLIKRAGATGILMEYEDTFPFWGALSIASARNAYKKKEIRYIQDLAKTHDLKIIPLVQTFGHLEFILKLPEFKNLREVEDIPQSVCPTNNNTLVMIKMMIDQVMALHPDAEYLHIGSDEVYQLGHCSRCSRYDRNSLFLAYVRKVAKYVRERHKVTPIMWDDMLRHATVTELQKYEMGKLVEPMAWSYVEDVYLFLPSSLWEKYSEVFPYLWTASAFKGAFGETLTVPDAKRHLENHKAWLNVMTEQNSSFSGFRGIALTGWQRYDHFASLCELLPAGLPSLILNLLTVSQGHFNNKIFPQMQELLDCSSRSHYHLDLEHDPNMWRALVVCFFPGSAVFRLTLRQYDVAKSLDKYIFDITTHKGWMTEYNVNHNFSSPLRINEMLRDFSYYNSSLQMLQEAAIKALREVYDDDTVSEWIELNIYPYVKKMNEIWRKGQILRKYQTWPRRPLSRFVELPSPPVDLGFVTS